MSNINLNKIYRFIIVGLANTISTYLIYIFLLRYIEYQLSYFFAYISGILFSFFMNSNFVFNAKVEKKLLLFYLTLYFFNYVASNYLLKILVVKIGVEEVYAPLIVICISSFFLFLILNQISRKVN